jgi:hypothetical protein
MTNQRISKFKRRRPTDYLTTIGFTALFIILVLTGMISGCSRPNPYPEKIDPIYLDLVERGNLAKAAAESAKAEIKKLREDLESLPARDPSRKKVQQDLTKKQTHLLVADQEALYFEIRSEQRKDYARRAYLDAFNRGLKWPNPEDFETYKKQRELQSAPREWNAKLEKSDRYNKKSEKEMRDEIDAKLKPPPGH